MEDVDQVWNLATDMGGIGYLSSHKLEPMRSVLINTYLLEAAAKADVERYLFTSSACVYGEGTDTREETAYPADCEDGYGWEKLFSERMCRHYTEERGLETRVARLHNVYGPHGSWDDGREKAPAALCRKVAEAVAEEKGSIEIWGDGSQQRSFLLHRGLSGRARRDHGRFLFGAGQPRLGGDGVDRAARPQGGADRRGGSEPPP